MEKETSDQNRSDHELLEALLREQTKSARSHFVVMIATIVLAAVLAVSCIILVPQAVSTLHRANEELDDLETTMTSIDEMVENANTILEKNDENINKSIEAISSIDIDSLNESIQDLRDILAPLSKLFGE